MTANLAFCTQFSLCPLYWVVPGRGLHFTDIPGLALCRGVLREVREGQNGTDTVDPELAAQYLWRATRLNVFRNQRWKVCPCPRALSNVGSELLQTPGTNGRDTAFTQRRP